MQTRDLGAHSLAGPRSLCPRPLRCTPWAGAETGSGPEACVSGQAEGWRVTKPSPGTAEGLRGRAQARWGH